MEAHTTTPTLADPLAEALRLVAEGNERGLTVRLMGGLAFQARVPTWLNRSHREGRDIDVAIPGRDQRGVAELLNEQGYEPDKTYNALYGRKQLYFVDPEWKRPVDVLIERLEMCHRLDFGSRLPLDRTTLPLADLLLSKMQIVHINRKDLLDMLAVLANYPLGEGDLDTINLPRIVDLTASDWGWWRTLTGNLEVLRRFAANDLTPDEFSFSTPPPFAVEAQLDKLASAVEAAPKSTRWRMRAQVGDRVSWYEEPEEVGHGR